MCALYTKLLNVYMILPTFAHWIQTNEIHNQRDEDSDQRSKEFDSEQAQYS